MFNFSFCIKCITNYISQFIDREYVAYAVIRRLHVICKDSRYKNSPTTEIYCDKFGKVSIIKHKKFS